MRARVGTTPQRQAEVRESSHTPRGSISAPRAPRGPSSLLSAPQENGAKSTKIHKGPLPTERGAPPSWMRLVDQNEPMSRAVPNGLRLIVTRGGRRAARGGAGVRLTRGGRRALCP
ncbi:hypothetical protein EVAR_31790_1 [Eumeta japonica]|uniref:Uncharacterized protein n=1 Tax=Eumeta variegata TaxID=151549 RepID=A0A4C1W6U0_EUMVA|nr:hypothetical protein EVAR_31790_1 [Eumeta japonica]